VLLVLVGWSLVPCSLGFKVPVLGLHVAAGGAAASRAFTVETAPAGVSSSMSAPSAWLAVGLDFGTSGARACLVDQGSRCILETNEVPFSSRDEASNPQIWSEALDDLIGGFSRNARGRVARLAVGGTSASCLLVDSASGKPTRDGVRMYDWSVADYGGSALADQVSTLIQESAPQSHTALASTSTLSKLVAWAIEEPLRDTEILAHQADFIMAHLWAGREAEQAPWMASHLAMGPLELRQRPGFVSDYHNSLKLGFDVQDLVYPEWLVGDSPVVQILTGARKGQGQSIRDRLPVVERPGSLVSRLSSTAIRRWGLHSQASVVAGSTDSISAFLAADLPLIPGNAVTSLGSTLAIKLLSDVRVDDASRGIYSHRLDDLWLVGGASNVGCAVLRAEGFSNQELASLSEELDPSFSSPLRYYPLTKVGERFPVNDPGKVPVLEPKPASRLAYLHAILEGIARVEKEGYHALADLGASHLRQVATAGGGSANAVWTTMRQRSLGVPTEQAAETEAAYGLALLALRDMPPAP